MKNSKIKLLVLCGVALLCAVVTIVIVCVTKNTDTPECLYGFSYTVNDDGVSCTVTGLGECTDESIVIGGSIDGYEISAIANDAFMNCDTLVSVTIEGSVKTIGEYAFYGCDALSSLTLNEGIIEVCDGAFAKCISISSVSIPKTLKTVGNRMFEGCESLLAVEIPYGVENIGKYTFGGCSALETITLPDSIKKIDWYAFSGCEGMRGVYISDMDMWYNIKFETAESNPLYYAKKLYLNFVPVTKISPVGIDGISAYAFYNCETIAAVILPDGIETLGAYAFAGCTNLESFTAIGDDFETIGAHALDGCNNLTKVYLGRGIRIINDGAFASCDNIEFVSYLGTEKEWNNTVAKGENAINAVVLFTDVVDENTNSMGLTGILSSDGSSYTVSGIGTCTDTNLYIYTIDRRTVVGVGDNAFEGCTQIASVSMSKYVVKIGNRAFAGCSELRRVSLSEKMTDLGNGAFYNCNSLTDIKIPEKIKSIEESTFAYCLSLNKINIPVAVKSIGKSAFFNCIALVRIDYDGTLDEWNEIAKAEGCFDTKMGNQVILYCNSGSYIIDKDGSIIKEYASKASEGLAYTKESDSTYMVSGIGTCKDNYIYISNKIISDREYEVIGIAWDAFKGDFQITGVTIAPGVPHIYSSAFENCKNLEEVRLPAGIVVTASAFDGCKNLKNIYMSEVSEIGYYAFRNCTSLESVDLSGVKDIGAYAFANCKNLKSVTIGADVEYIRTEAFAGCGMLEKIYYNGTKEQWSKISKHDNCFSGREGTVLICTDGAFVINSRGNTTTSSVYFSQGLSVKMEYLDMNRWIKGIGTCTDTFLKIPLNNDPLTYEQNIKGIYNSAFDGNVDITGLMVQEGINDISYQAFANCQNLVEVYLPLGLNIIGSEAFINCSSLEIVQIQAAGTIGKGAFDNCENLKTLMLGIKVKAIKSDAFADCISLEKIYYGGTKEQWEEIKKDNYCFDNSTNATLVCTDGEYKIDKNGNIVIEDEGNVGGDDGDGDLIYSEGFKYTVNEDGLTCTLIDIFRCKDNDIVIGGSIDGYKITGIADKAFQNLAQIRTLVIDDGVEYIGYMAFDNCQNLRSVTILSDVKEFGTHVFYNCQSLKDVNFSGNIEVIPKYTFAYCYALEHVTLSSPIVRIEKSAFDTCTSLTQITIPKSVTKIESEAFIRCLAIKKVIYEGSSREWENIYTKYAFNSSEISFIVECTDMNISYKNDIDYDITDEELVIVVGTGTYVERNIVIPETYLELEVVEIDKKAFDGCTYLQTVSIPKTIKKIGNSAFSRCTVLNTVEIYSRDITFGENVFAGCTQLKSIAFNGTVEEWHKIEKGDGWNPPCDFIVYCSDGHIAYDLYGNIIPNELIEGMRFEYNVYSQNKVEIMGIGDNMTEDLIIYSYLFENGNMYYVEKIADNAFANNLDIKSITISENIRSIGNEAFSGCENLETIILNSKNITIGQKALNSCVSLKRIIFAGTKEEWNGIYKGLNWRNKTNLFVVECTDGEISYG